MLLHSQPAVHYVCNCRYISSPCKRARSCCTISSSATTASGLICGICSAAASGCSGLVAALRPAQPALLLLTCVCVLRLHTVLRLQTSGTLDFVCVSQVVCERPLPAPVMHAPVVLPQRQVHILRGTQQQQPAFESLSPRWKPLCKPTGCQSATRIEISRQESMMHINVQLQRSQQPQGSEREAQEQGDITHTCSPMSAAVCHELRASPGAACAHKRVCTWTCRNH